MTPPAVHESQSSLEAALLDVDATLADLLIAADEQHAAVVAVDFERLESVTRLQKALVFAARTRRAHTPGAAGRDVFRRGFGRSTG
jgi:hypothetical protein